MKTEVIEKLKDILAEATETDYSVCYVTSNDADTLKAAIKALEQEPCEDTVSRKAVDELSKELVHTTRDKADFLCNFWERLQKLPPVTPQEPKMGHWIDADGDNAICGCCNRLNHLYGTYCKHCGAKMVEPQESEEI